LPPHNTTRDHINNSMLFSWCLFSSIANVGLVLAAMIAYFRCRNIFLIYTAYLTYLFFRAICWSYYGDAMSVITEDDEFYLQQSTVNAIIWLTLGVCLGKLFCACFRVPCHMPGTKSRLMVEYVDTKNGGNGSIVKRKFVPAVTAYSFFRGDDGSTSRIHELNIRLFRKYLFSLIILLIPLYFMDCNIPLIVTSVSGCLFALILLCLLIWFDYWLNRTSYGSMAEMEDNNKMFEASYENDYLWDRCQNYGHIYLGLGLTVIVLILPVWIFPSLMTTLYCFIIAIPLIIIYSSYGVYLTRRIQSTGMPVATEAIAASK